MDRVAEMASAGESAPCVETLHSTPIAVAFGEASPATAARHAGVNRPATESATGRRKGPTPQPRGTCVAAEGCGKRVAVLRVNLCIAHYTRLYRHGSTENIKKPKPIEGRFWSKVDKNGPVPAHVPELGPCWIFKGAKTKFGYGKIGKHGTRAGHIGAHRAAWELVNGPVPDGLFVLHRCDNPPCVRAEADPACSHLFLGTQDDNLRDMREKGRGRHGPAKVGATNGRARLVAAQVLEIRALHAAGMKRPVLAERFGVSQGAIQHITDGRSWRHLLPAAAPAVESPAPEPPRRYRLHVDGELRREVELTPATRLALEAKLQAARLGSYVLEPIGSGR